VSEATLLMDARKKVRDRYCADWRQPIYKGRITIQTEDMQNIPLVPNEVQTELIEMIWQKWCNNEPVRLVIPKPRREGISTACEAIGYSITSFTPAYAGFILGYDDENARTIFEMTKRMHENMEPFLKTQTKASNVKELVFSETDSKIIIGSAQNKDIRGKGISFFHGSEVAFYPYPKETLGGFLPSIPNKPKTIILLESTGNGINWFERMCKLAEQGKGDYTLFFIPWFRNKSHALPLDDDETITPQSSGSYGDEIGLIEEFGVTIEQIKWRRNMIDTTFDGDLHFFMQEYPSNLDECFQGSGYPVFDHIKLNEMLKHAIKPAQTGLIEDGEVVLSNDNRGWLSVWKKPVDEEWAHRYCISADTGGLSEDADYDQAYVRDRVTGETCAAIHGHFDAYNYVEYLYILSKWYQNALMAVEINITNSETDEFGNTVVDTLIQNYPKSNLYRHKIIDDQTKHETSKVGFHTDKKTKQGVVNRLRKFVNEWYQIDTKYYDAELIDELKTYIVTQTKTGKTSWNAVEGKKDDRVMAYGIGLVVSDTMPTPHLVKEHRQKTGTNDALEGLL
jgi:hypothetical protein